ncbi:hypothetical protein JXA85_03075 [Candidatus Woesearchaeota archaeon]|nr:hypothetical protein [Candidatus Woesearchaeota archaeon]
MSFDFDISDRLKETLDKLGNKDRILAVAVRKKIEQIINLDSMAIQHFKNLKGDMSHLKRVHIGCLVLTFEVRGDEIYFESLKQHDEAYR